MDIPDSSLWQRVLLVAAGGAAGALGRYGLASGIKRFAGADFPWGTMTVNALGCLGFGVIAGIVAIRGPASEWMVFFLLIGFMGSFTTFSTFAHDSLALVQDGRWWSLSINILVQNSVGLALVLLGVQLGRWTMGQSA